MSYDALPQDQQIRVDAQVIKLFSENSNDFIEKFQRNMSQLSEGSTSVGAFHALTSAMRDVLARDHANLPPLTQAPGAHEQHNQRDIIEGVGQYLTSGFAGFDSKFLSDNTRVQGILHHLAPQEGTYARSGHEIMAQAMSAGIDCARFEYGHEAATQNVPMAAQMRSQGVLLGA